MNFTYPCSICIVNACCSLYCTKYFAFVNKIVKNFPDNMTREQIKKYYSSTSKETKNKINNFIRTGRVYSFSKNSSFRPRFIPVKKYRRAAAGSVVYETFYGNVKGGIE